MLKVWGRRNAQNVQKVMWLVGELGLPHEHIPAGGASGRLAEANFGALNPNRLIPVIEDGTAVVWESHAILRYLAATYGPEWLWPSQAYARSLADRWLDWSQSLWEPAFVTGVFWGYFRTPEPDRDETSVAAALQRCAALIGIAEAVLADRPFLAGQEFSLADIPFGSTLYRYFGVDIDRPPAPNVEAYFARLQGRPAYREHVMIPFADLRGRLAF
ncbi:MAG TPA: glutathione S-transferase family protein [Caulobacteraceae bacterium]|jgi:glutathione S-transferase|nr:glutathione S-transferase family protein [Caulobacteraceae bacterium]